MNTEKSCTRCNKIQPLESFTVHKRMKDGRSQYCKLCNSKWARSWRKNHPVKCREAKKRYHDKNREAIFERQREHMARLKDRVYNIYGNKCACCGETTKEFFAVDHIEGGGTKERKRLGTRGIFIAASREGFKKEKYQLLCHNCNMSLGFFGYCPHRPDIRRPYHKNHIKKTGDVLQASVYPS